VGLNVYMPAMGIKPEMNNVASFVSTGCPGVYEGKAKLESAGDIRSSAKPQGFARERGAMLMPLNYWLLARL
jgi:hypothetical protein